MSNLQLSGDTRKTLCVQIGDAAGRELVALLQELARRVETLENTKVSITAIVPPDGDNLNDVLPQRRAG